MNGFPTLTSADVKKAALDFGADLVSIGSIDRWKDVPEEDNPKTIMPNAQSVVCIGFRVHRGSLRAAEMGTYYSAYTLSEFNDLNRIIAPMAQRRLTSLFEGCGYEAVPIMYYSHNLSANTKTTFQRPDGSSRPMQEIFFNFRVGGVLCGMGEIGHSRILLTPEFGPAQRLYFVVTEAKLAADPIISGICDHCMECVKRCPANALQYSASDNIDIPDVTSIKRSALDNIKCRLAHICGGLSPYAPEDIKQYVKNITDGTDTQTVDGSPRPGTEMLAEKVTNHVSFAANAEKIFGSPSALCGDGCVRACLAHLDETDRLSQKFKSAFRT